MCFNFVPIKFILIQHFIFFRNYKLSDGSINKKYSFQDIRNLFLSHDLVDNKLIPKRWIENHFCLIIRKLAATEISFPDHFSNT